MTTTIKRLCATKSGRGISPVYAFGNPAFQWHVPERYEDAVQVSGRVELLEVDPFAGEQGYYMLEAAWMNNGGLVATGSALLKIAADGLHAEANITFTRKGGLALRRSGLLLSESHPCDVTVYRVVSLTPQ